MSDYLTKEERLLLNLLKVTLNNDKMNLPEQSDADWNKLFYIAEKHAVLSLLYDRLVDVKLPEDLKIYLMSLSSRTVQQSYHLTFLSKALIDLFEQNGIFCVVLKGVSASVGYPVPELRKSGDIDLLIEPDNINQAESLLEKNGFIKNDEQHANHHVSYGSEEGIDIEIHTMIAEPFDNNAINSYLEKLVYECRNHSIIKDVMGVSIKTLDDGYFAYQLLLHMLQHFLRAGFGLKLLCDWVTLWNGKVSDQSKIDYLRLVKESKLKGFSDVITAVCVYELGLKEENIKFMFSEEKYKLPKKSVAIAFVNEILEAEEFGRSAEDRMVIMRGTGVEDYIREFHHQMQLNFPKAGKVFISWPVTWTVTLVRFLINNKKVRNISTKDILKKAHSRSKLMENIKLFKK